MSGSDRHGKQSGAKEEKIYYKRCILCPDCGTCMGRSAGITGFTDDAVYHCFSGSGSDPGTGKEVQGIKKAEKAFVYCFLCVFYGLLLLLAAWASLKFLDGVENLIRQVPHFYNTTIVPVFETISNYLEESMTSVESFCGKYH